MLEDKNSVQQFLTLQGKEELELKAICEGMQLNTEGTKEQLIDKLLQLNITKQSSVIKAQAIPLRTRDANSQPIQAAMDAMRLWRKMIFKATNNKKEFQLLNGKNQAYTINLNYLKCSSATLQKIITDGWCLPLAHHKDLTGMLLKEPDKFEINIIQKPDGRGNNWLMLHVSAKVKE